jgi:hypothetical protein
VSDRPSRLLRAPLAVLITLIVLAVPASALAGPAAYTATNPDVDGPGTCLNGNQNAADGPVNCNLYTSKNYVWLNAGPATASLGDGDYFFAVLAPGGQADPNDGSAKLLSTDTHTERTFSVSGGVVSYDTTLGHDFDGQKIRLMDYADTPNPGGVYILAICSLDSGYPVDPSTCKYDAFKAPDSDCQSEDCTPTTTATDPTVTKDANGAYTRSYDWDITKAADKTTVKQIGGSVTVNYTVDVTHDSGTDSAVGVSGTITVSDLNVDGDGNTVPVDITGVTDQLSDGTVCTVTGGGAQTLTQEKTDFPYSCSLSAVPQGELDNTVTVEWPGQALDNGDALAAGTSDFTFSSIAFTEDPVDECVNLSDTFAGSNVTGTLCNTDPSPTEFKYSRTIAVVAGCQTYNNTASFLAVDDDNDTGQTGSAGASVTICGPSQTGALTIGFWKTTNGQSLIGTYCAPAGKQSLATYLAGLGAGSGPFSDATGKSCSQLKTYVSSILGGANATNMNIMLKAQMLATALDVYFSDPAKGWTSTTLSKVKPPSTFIASGKVLGGFNMDMTAICPMVDNTTTGSALCKSATPSTNGVASGAFPTSPMTVQALLDYESTTPSPFNGSVSAPVWYAANRTKQEIAKNAFDQINNQLAFTV